MQQKKATWSSHIANRRKKLLKRVAVLVRIKKSLPFKYRLILGLMLVLNLFSNIVYLFGEVVMQDYWMTFLKLRNDVRVLFLLLLFRLETLPLFLEPGWLPINHICMERRLFLLKEILN